MSSLHLDDARKFLAALDGGSASFTFQTFDDGPKKGRELIRVLNGTLDDLAGDLAGLNALGAGVFVTVNKTCGGRRRAEDVRALRAVFIDADDRPMPDVWSLPPSIIVQRDERHWHAYWLLKAGESLADFERAQVQLLAYYQTDPTVKDLPRVMRVPGFAHCKGEAVPVRLVSIIWAGGGSFRDAAPLPRPRPVPFCADPGRPPRRKARERSGWPPSSWPA